MKHIENEILTSVTAQAQSQQQYHLESLSKPSQPRPSINWGIEGERLYSF
jgi:hypothetical protein